MAEVHIFTSAAANYLPKVRVLFQSLRRWRPDWRLHLVLADRAPAPAVLAAAGADEVHTPADLDIPNWQAWAFGHSLVELATAIKPFALRKLLARPDAGAAIYLDPDVVVFSRLEEIERAVAEADIVLTPHQIEAERTVDGIISKEICTAQHGIYNLGFVAVSARPDGRAFADWWAMRTYHFCRQDIPNGLFTDQRWIDFVPGLFDRVKVLRSPVYNVARWNLTTRRLEGDRRRGLTVNGQALGFYHFSGIDLDPKAPAGDQAKGAELVRWYRRETRVRHAERPGQAGWGFATFADGMAIQPEQRWVYRLRGDLQRAYPDPFASAPGGYQDWWRGQAAIEFPDLFNPATREAELRRLSGALTTGYAPLAL